MTDPNPSSLNTTLPSKLDRNHPRAKNNAAGMLALLAQLRMQETAIREGGGAKAIESQHAKKRLTARERIALLLDPETELFELSLFAAFGMYEDWGGAPAAGTVTGLGRVCGRLCMIIANDATVKAGAFFPMTAKKVIRAQTIAMENRIPTLYLVDSAGVFLPLQEDVFPDQDDFGRIFRNNAVMSAMGIPQMTAIMGMCVAGGAYLPVMTDHVLMTEGSGLFLAGPALVQAAIGQKYSAEELGGAAMHSEISGTVDFKEPNDHLCIARLRSLVAKVGHRPGAPFDRAAYDGEKDAPKYPAEDLYSLLDPDPAKPSSYDMHEVIARIVDRSEFDEYKPDYGRTVLCGYGRVGGFAVGIVANQKQPQPHIESKSSHAGEKRIEFGGVIYAESAEKAARFIMDCNQNLIPLLFLHDVNGFMVGRDAEWSGIIRAGAKMVTAVANSTVPKITVIVGGSFGAGNYAMCGKAYDPRFIFAWPTARYAVMSGASAANTLVEIKIKQLERGGKKLSNEEKQELLASIKATYDEQTDCRYAAARLWVDAIIDPAQTRDAILTALEAAALNPDVPKFNAGVIQT
ncbi:acetyl-CoA carboxylase carboxyltransferase component [Silvibacterium bohemicum]|uniref:Acetyl-CoA carboxylase carboxyltransferase component n=1 Tax=Silvibacterium bohemicum TaxID=1577686 RepID=A0A841JNA6_9BACT|nr:acyl-CoA carboxylase subunit beta [Silvibacterium bohemicum]MBB6142733.1 acetyl-CoA carboxylase carboxyltransferase component [Silvibacterium bohemicum]